MLQNNDRVMEAMKKIGKLRDFVLFGAVSVLMGCAATPAVVEPVVLSPILLGNFTYQGLRGLPSVTLQDGNGPVPLAAPAGNAPAMTPGSADTAVHLVEDLMVQGQLQGDAQMEAVVLLEQWTGPTTVATYAAVVAIAHSQPVNVATVWLGENVQVRDVRIEQQLLVVDLVNAGVDDSPCCPSQRVSMRWQWEQNTLMPLDSTVEGGRLSVSDIAGHEWQLAYWQQDEPDLSDPPLTLSYQEGKFAGFAGCNRYFATVLDGQLPGDLLVTQPANTRMACPEPGSSTEARFLSLLGKVERFTFTPRGLALSYRLDAQNSGVLYFQIAGEVRRAPAAPPPVKATPRREESPLRSNSSTNGFDTYDF